MFFEVHVLWHQLLKPSFRGDSGLTIPLHLSQFKTARLNIGRVSNIFSIRPEKLQKKIKKKWFIN